MLDFEKFEALSFDCYGTLVDWESGILGTLQPVLSAHGITLSDEKVLELYAELEGEAEADAFQPYKLILARVMEGLGARLGFSPTAIERECLISSIKNWQPFADTVPALLALKKRYKLAVISNVDDDLFAFTAKHLGVTFDWVVTAEQVGSYKPSPNNFERALEKIGLGADKILHVAQSIYHDIVPAKQLGWKTVWVNRRQGKAGFGATPPAHARPDLEVPSLDALVLKLDTK
jgi:2-haloacid dehalogenase